MPEQYPTIIASKPWVGEGRRSRRPPFSTRRKVQVADIHAHKQALSYAYVAAQTTFRERTQIGESNFIHLELLAIDYVPLPKLEEADHVEVQDIQCWDVPVDSIDLEEIPSETWEDWIANLGNPNDDEFVTVKIIRVAIRQELVNALQDRLQSNHEHRSEFEGIHGIRPAHPARTSRQADSGYYSCHLTAGLSRQEAATISAQLRETAPAANEIQVVPCGQDYALNIKGTPELIEYIASQVPDIIGIEAREFYEPRTTAVQGIGLVAGFEPSPISRVPIVVMDGGFDQANPLLYDVLNDVHDFTGATPPDPDWPHGTQVAGRAAYHDQHTTGLARRFRHPIRGAKVISTRTKFAFDLPTQIENVMAKWPDTRVIVASLNRSKSYYSYESDEYSVDELLRKYPKLVIIVSAGNIDITNMGHYPDLHTNPARYQSWIQGPGRALGAITVGSASLETPTAGQLAQAGHASPFSRHGAQTLFRKPEFIHEGGNIDAHTKLSVIHLSPVLLNGTTNHPDPANEANWHWDIGTSFAAPLVAHEAATLAHDHPDARGATIRALLADAAERPGPGLPNSDDLALRGLGVPRRTLIESGDKRRATIIIETEVEVAGQRDIELPIPPELQQPGSHRTLQITVSYHPPMRRVGLAAVPAVRLATTLQDDKNRSKNNTRDTQRSWRWLRDANTSTLRCASWQFRDRQLLAVSREGVPWHLQIRATRDAEVPRPVPEGTTIPVSVVISVESRTKDNVHQLVTEFVRQRQMARQAT